MAADGAATARAHVRTIVDRVRPHGSDYPHEPAAWARDILAGLTVGVVALPLALGFGVASGVGAEAGIVTAIVAGIVAAVFGGSNVQVSGPTGAMTVVLAPIVASHGSAAIPLVAVLAGVMLVVGGLLGIGQSVTLIPWPVIEGFTIGIATIIFLQQVPVLLGVTDPSGHGPVIAAWDAVTRAGIADSIDAIAIAAAVVVVIVVGAVLRPTFPASLLAIALAGGASAVLGLDIATIDNLSLAAFDPGFDVGALGATGELMRAAFVVAMLAALESLLSARVADGMLATASTDPDRELVGQGLANVASGMFGGMPATGAIARTAVNVRAGGRTRAAAAMHGVVLAVVLAGAGALVSEIPLAALAGVLMVTAVRMADPHVARSLMRASRSDALVFVTTAFVTIAFDLVLAVEVGIAIAAVFALRAVARSSRIQEERLAEHPDLDLDGDDQLLPLLESHIVVYRLEGALFFGAAQRFLDRLVTLDDARVVILRMGWIQSLDSTGAHALADSIEHLERRGTAVLLCGVQPVHRRALAGAGIPGRVIAPGRMFGRLAAAVDAARELAA